MTYRTLPPDQQQLFLAALKGITANPELFGSRRKISPSEAVKLAADVAKEASPERDGPVWYIPYPL